MTIQPGPTPTAQHPGSLEPPRPSVERTVGHTQFRTAGVAFGVAVALHTADHLRRGQGSITELLYVMGNLSLVLSIVTVTLIITGHRLAPLFAAASGLPLAVGFAAAHWLPRWSDMSDPVWEISTLPGLSYAASLLEIATAAAVGIAGIRIVRAQGLDSFGRRPPEGPPVASMPG